MTKKTKKKVSKKVVNDTVAVTRNGDTVNVKPEKLESFLAAGWLRG